jgi:hypothetical protein
MQKSQTKRISYNALMDAKNHILNMEKWEKTYTKNKKKSRYYNALTDAKIMNKTDIL